MVNVVGPPVTTVSATVRVPLVAQTIWNQLPVTFTGSLKVMVRFGVPADRGAIGRRRRGHARRASVVKLKT